MQQREVEIVKTLGLNAPASGKLSQLAAKYQCDVSLKRNGRKVNAKSLMGLMMQAASKGSPYRAGNRRSGRNRSVGRHRRADRRWFR
jgi:phosphotransferase system HPr (HPr) family protein